jgi:hypothetical protein
MFLFWGCGLNPVASTPCTTRSHPELGVGVVYMDKGTAKEKKKLI